MLQRKLSQLIYSPLYNHLQFLVAHWLKGVCRGIHSGG
jgi:hypothetical protein